jgi:hypothetical protein
VVDKLVCDRCGGGLLLDAPVRYELTMQLKAAYDPLEVMQSDLDNVDAELRKVLRQLEGVSAEQAQDQVYREFCFDLCATCQREFLDEPLPPGPDSATQ